VSWTFYRQIVFGAKSTEFDLVSNVQLAKDRYVEKKYVYQMFTLS